MTRFICANLRVFFWTPMAAAWWSGGGGGAGARWRRQQLVVILFGGAALPRFRLLFSNIKIGRRRCRSTQHARPVVGPGIAAPPREYAGTAIESLTGREGFTRAGTKCAPFMAQSYWQQRQRRRRMGSPFAFHPTATATATATSDHPYLRFVAVAVARSQDKATPIPIASPCQTPASSELGARSSLRLAPVVPPRSLSDSTTASRQGPLRLSLFCRSFRPALAASPT